MLTQQQTEMSIARQTGRVNNQVQSAQYDQDSDNDSESSDSENDHDEVAAHDDASANVDTGMSAPSSGVTGVDDQHEREERLLRELNIDEYGSSDGEVNESVDDGDNTSDAHLWLSGRQLTVYGDNADDPYITLPDGEDSDSDAEQLMIQASDNVILIGNTDEVGENSNLEMYVYDGDTGDLYVHHDLALPAFPLAIQWISVDPRNTDSVGAFACVGTFDASIEIWNLDVVDALEPVAVLGENQKGGQTKQKKKLADKITADSHTEAVTCLGWHPAHSTRLASGSADCTIRLWSLQTHACTQVLTHHTDKLIGLQWNPVEPYVLLSCGEDKQVCMVDVRKPDQVMSLRCNHAIECVQWSRHQPFMFVVALDNGSVQMHDARKLSTTSTDLHASLVFTVAAHDDACTSVTFNAGVPTLMATAGLDKCVKLWDYTDNQPTMIATRSMQAGKLFTCSFDVSADTPFLLACGGDKGKLAVWDVTENKHVQNKYAQYISKTRHAGIKHASEQDNIAARGSTAAERRKASKRNAAGRDNSVQSDSHSDTDQSDINED